MRGGSDPVVDVVVSTGCHRRFVVHDVAAASTAGTAEELLNVVFEADRRRQAAASWCSAAAVRGQASCSGERTRAAAAWRATRATTLTSARRCTTERCRARAA